MPQNKNQHYVPRFYFRNFSKDRKKICIFNLPRELFVKDANIEGQCSKNYFYSKNTNIEKTFSWLEGLASEKIIKLIRNKTFNCFSREEVEHLKSHILFQHGRTKIAYDRENEMINHYFDLLKPQMYAEISKGGKSVSWDSIKETKIVLNSSHTLLTSMMSGILLSDLETVLLENKTKMDFIFSDNPVVLFNSFFNDIHPYGTTGISATGLQIFYPINSKMMVFLFDPNFYKLSDKINLKIEDIQRLNGLQILNCDKNVYFENHKIKDKVLERYKQIKFKIPKKKIETEIVKTTIDAGGNPRFLYRTSNPKIKYDLNKLSFLKHKKNDSPYGVRNPWLNDINTKIINAVDDKKIKSMDDLSKFLKTITDNKKS